MADAERRRARQTRRSKIAALLCAAALLGAALGCCAVALEAAAEEARSPPSVDPDAPGSDGDAPTPDSSRHRRACWQACLELRDADRVRYRIKMTTGNGPASACGVRYARSFITRAECQAYLDGRAWQRCRFAASARGLEYGTEWWRDGRGGCAAPPCSMAPLSGFNRAFARISAWRDERRIVCRSASLGRCYLPADPPGVCDTPPPWR